MNKIGVIGAGAWGTALACAARRAGCSVLLQAHEPQLAELINQTHTNPTYLANVTLDSAIKATNSLKQAADCDIILLVAPAQYLRVTCQNLAPHLKPKTPVVICAKGIEQGTGALMSEVVAQELPQAVIAILSGPTFAAELARDMPTACTLACEDKSLAEKLANTLSSPRFRTYYSDDVVGAQIGGAVKNVMAIASGMIAGKGYGDNAKAALITRGIAEIARLGLAKGAKIETLLGLAGMGDLVLTCNSMQSRNFSLGVALGQGQSLESILSSRNAVTEGVFTARSVCDLAAKMKVDMPISFAVNQVLNDGAQLDHVITDLLSRPIKEETT